MFVWWLGNPDVSGPSSSTSKGSIDPELPVKKA